MARPKGIPKTGGRQPGTPNKTTAELRAFLTNFVFEKLEKNRDKFDDIEVKDQYAILTKMTDFIIPKPQLEIEPPQSTTASTFEKVQMAIQEAERKSKET